MNYLSAPFIVLTIRSRGNCRIPMKLEVWEFVKVRVFPVGVDRSINQYKNVSLSLVYHLKVMSCFKGGKPVNINMGDLEVIHHHGGYRGLCPIA